MSLSSFALLFALAALVIGAGCGALRVMIRGRSTPVDRYAVSSIALGVLTTSIGALWYSPPSIIGLVIGGVLLGVAGTALRTRLLFPGVLLGLLVGYSAWILVVAFANGADAATCWNCRRGDWTNGAYFVFGLLILTLRTVIVGAIGWTVWRMATFRRAID